MKTTAESKWRALIAAQARSGQSVREFASTRGINVTTLYWWRSRLGAGRAPGRRDESAGDLVPVTVIEGGDGPPKANNSFELELGAMTLRIPPGFAESDLRRLLQALRC